MPAILQKLSQAFLGKLREARNENFPEGLWIMTGILRYWRSIARFFRIILKIMPVFEIILIFLEYAFQEGNIKQVQIMYLL